MLPILFIELKKNYGAVPRVATQASADSWAEAAASSGVVVPAITPSRLGRQASNAQRISGAAG